MNKHNSIAALIVFSIFCGRFTQILPAQGAGRTVHVDGRTPLTKLVRPDDELIVVQPSGFRAPPLTEVSGAPHTIEGDLAEILRADAIFVADVSGRRSFFVESDTWIRSSIQLSIVSTIRDAEPTVTDSDRLLRFEINSGEMRVGKALVRAGNAHHYEPGERYLLGFKRFVGGRPPTLLFWYQVDRSGKLVKPTEEVMDSQPNSVLYGKELSEVITELAKRIGQ